VHASRILRQGALALPRRLALAALIAAAGLACAGRAAAAPAPHWSSGFETGDLAEWLISGDVTEPPPVVDAVHVRSGRDAAHFEIPAGGGPRDIQRQYIMPRSPAGDIFLWKEGDEAWFGFSYYLAPDFPNPSGAWYDLTQWWSPAGGSPPLELAIPAGSSDFMIQGGWGSPLGHRLSSRDLGPVATGEWIDWVVHVVFSSDPTKGTVDVWRDGTRVVSGWKPIGGTLYPGAASYLETGIYRQTSEDGAEMWQDQWAIGTSHAEVDPARADGGYRGPPSAGIPATPTAPTAPAERAVPPPSAPARRARSALPPPRFFVIKRSRRFLTFRAAAPKGGTVVVAGRLRPWGRQLNARNGAGARILAAGRGIVRGRVAISSRLRLRAFVYRTGIPRSTASIVSSRGIRVLDPTRRPAGG
jgi:hypothetical protein